MYWFSWFGKTFALYSRIIRIALALLVILSYVGISAYFLPKIIADYDEVINSSKPRTFQFPININLNGTVGFFEPQVSIGLTITYPRGILIVDEPVKVHGHAVLDNETAYNVSVIVVVFQNCLKYPMNYTYKGIPRQGFIVFNATDRMLDYNRITGKAVYNILGDSTISWPIDGESKTILGIFYNDGTNTTMAINDLVLHVYPKEQLTQIQTNKVTTELTVAVFIFATFGVFSIASDIWPRKNSNSKASNSELHRLIIRCQKSQTPNLNNKQKNQKNISECLYHKTQNK